MAELSFLAKQVPGIKTTTGTTLQPVTDYTITWEDLVAKGFEDGDEIGILIRYQAGGSGANYVQASHDIRIGSVYTSALVLHDGQTELRRNNWFQEAGFVRKVTLSTDDDIYIGLAAEATFTARSPISPPPSPSPTPGP